MSLELRKSYNTGILNIAFSAQDRWAYYASLLVVSWLGNGFLPEVDQLMSWPHHVVLRRLKIHEAIFTTQNSYPLYLCNGTWVHVSC